MAKIDGSSSKNNYGFYAILTEQLETNYLDTNTTKVNYEVYMVNSDTRTNSSNWTFNAKIDGTNVYNETKQTLNTTTSNTYEKVLVFKGNKDVKHNNDGSKKISFSATLTKSTAYSRYDPGKCSLSGNFTLTTIPRASTYSVSNTFPNIGENITIAINRKNDNYIHDLTWKTYDNKLSGIIATKTTDTSIIWTIPEEIYDLIPDKDRITIRLLLTTFNAEGTTQIGDVFGEDGGIIATVNRELYKPDVSYTITETNEKVIAVTDNLVINASKPKFNITATAKKGASIGSIVVSNEDGQNYNGVEVTFKEIGTSKFEIVVTDSRGISNIIDLDLTTQDIDYIKPNIKTLEVNRKSPTSGNVILNASGDFYNGQFSSETGGNFLDISYRFKENVRDATWSGLVSIPTDAISFDGNGYTITDYDLGTITEYNKNYVFEFYYSDALFSNGVPTSRIVRKGITTYNYGEHDLQVNGDLFVADEDGLNKEKINVSGKVSKNLFDKNNANKVIGYSGSSEIITGTTGRIVYIKCEPNTTYTIQKKQSNRFVVSCSTNVPAVGTSVTRLVAGADTQATVTTTDNAEYLILDYFDNDANEQEILDSIQIEKGSTATEYEEYYEPTISIRDSKNIFQEVQMPLISTRKISFNHDYVYETDLQYHCFKIGKMVVLNIHTIAFKQTITNGMQLMSNLPKSREFIVWYLHGGNDANGTSVRCSVNTNGDVLAHYGGTDRYGDSASKQYSGILVYETSE